VEEGGVSVEASDSASVTIVIPGEEYIIFLPIVYK
jgi:hypothetical protein